MQIRNNISLIIPHTFNGTLHIPPSKSHAIRQLLINALSNCVLQTDHPAEFNSLDLLSCMAACRILRTVIAEKKPGPVRIINAGNSGTTLFFAIAAAALGSSPVQFTGDNQLSKRSAGPLLDALGGLGITVNSHNGFIPITICGPWKGGKISLPCPTSQYLSALLIAAPLAPQGTVTEIDVPFLNEKPYIEMTLNYLKKLGIYSQEKDSHIIAAPDFSYFSIRGGNTYTPLNNPVPGDFSSAAFPAAAAAVTEGNVTLQGLDPNDIQGDKVFFKYLEQMGCNVRWEIKSVEAFPKTNILENHDHWQVNISRSGPLIGGFFDLNATPDLLPVMAVLGAYAQGETALVNVNHARIKETDRIAVMAKELHKLFVHNKNFRCIEKPDGLVLHGIGLPNRLTARHDNITDPSYDDRPHITLDSHGDHRIAMALTSAALAAPEPVAINGAEAADISYPGFFQLLTREV